MQENGKPEPKIPSVEALMVGSLLLLADILDLIPGVGDIVTDVIAFPSEQIYLRTKGVNGNFALIGNLIELIPLVGDVLPARTIAFLVTIYADRHPDAFGGMLKVGEVLASRGGALKSGAGPMNLKNTMGSINGRVVIAQKEAATSGMVSPAGRTIIRQPTDSTAGPAAAEKPDRISPSRIIYRDRISPSRIIDRDKISPSRIIDRDKISPEFLEKTGVDILREGLSRGLTLEDIDQNPVQINGSTVDLRPAKIEEARRTVPKRVTPKQ